MNNEKTLKDIQEEIANMKVSRSSEANQARLTRHGYEDGEKIYLRGSNGRKYWVAPYAARDRIGLNYSNRQSTIEKWCA